MKCTLILVERREAPQELVKILLIEPTRKKEER